MKPVPHGEPYAGNLHVRFDEGAGVPDKKVRPALLYTPWEENVRLLISQAVLRQKWDFLGAWRFSLRGHTIER